jgi:hypothetical protein
MHLHSPGHRLTGNRRDSFNGVGWETPPTIINDDIRLAFKAKHRDEKTAQAARLLRYAVTHCASSVVNIQRLPTDIGAAVRSRDFASTCQKLETK